jgi:hypothetical protein
MERLVIFENLIGRGSGWGVDMRDPYLWMRGSAATTVGRARAAVKFNEDRQLLKHYFSDLPEALMERAAMREDIGRRSNVEESKPTLASFLPRS